MGINTLDSRLDNSREGNSMKYLGIIVTLALALGGGLIGYGQLQAKQEGNTEKVAEVKKELNKVEGDIKEQAVDIDELENFSIKQTLIIERITDNLADLEEKLKKP